MIFGQDRADGQGLGRNKDTRGRKLLRSCLHLLALLLEAAQEAAGQQDHQQHTDTCDGN